MKITRTLILLLLLLLACSVTQAQTPTYLDKPELKSLYVWAGIPYWPYDVELIQIAGSGQLKFASSQNGTYTTSKMVTIWTDGFGNGVVSYWQKGTVNGSATRQACGYNFSGCWTNEVFTVFAISTIEYVNINSPLDDHPTYSVFGCGSQAACGKRIYPDRQFRDDTTSRRRVRVRATLTSPISGQSIYFRSLDLDDPSSNDTAVDKDGAGAADNRGNTPNGILSAVGANGTTNTHTGTTNGSGVAEADFLVTMNPGDNFMVAASGNQTVVNGITASGITLKDSVNNTLPTATAKSTLMVTVWRRLNLEVDNMGEVLDGSNSIVGITGTGFLSGGNTVVPLGTTLDDGRFESGKIWIDDTPYTVISSTTTTVTLPGTLNPGKLANQFFLLYDDDNYDSTGPLEGDENQTSIETRTALEKMQSSDNPTLNVFAPVYITPLNNGGGDMNNNGSAAFVLNTPNNSTTVRNHINAARQSTGSNDYWVAYFQIGYQGDIALDYDSSIEAANGQVGGTPQDANNSNTADLVNSDCSGVPRGEVGSVIFQESIRDFFDIIVPADDTLTAPHELGHQFGLRGDSGSYEIMGNSVGVSTFVPAHRHIVRCRVKSPGLT